MIELWVTSERRQEDRAFPILDTDAFVENHVSDLRRESSETQW
jgi:hypothetical protein